MKRIVLLVLCAFALGFLTGRVERPSGRPMGYPAKLEVYAPPHSDRESAPPPETMRVYRIHDNGKTHDVVDGGAEGRLWRVVLIEGDRRVGLYAYTIQ